MTYQEAVNAELGLPADASADQALKTMAKNLNDGIAHGTTTERERIFAIIDSEAAKGREALAVNLARVHVMTAESAAAVLSALPKASAPGWSEDSGEIRQTTDGGPSGMNGAAANSGWKAAIEKVTQQRG